ncbi:hypothetical protein [Burkholderia gladioli]|uniref:hypothetical protein n=1 Tax=Burkholderia gladioli TaxID=28095 RepID=UPI00163FF50C|nr:hypothetical protein [Burkholderia gladioli]
MTDHEKIPAQGGEMPPGERAASTGGRGIDTILGAAPAGNAAHERNTNAAALDRDIAHLIDCSEGGIARVPRETLVRLRALLTSQPAGLPRHVLASLECTAVWLEKGNDPQDAARELRACLAKIDAAPAAPVAEAEPKKLNAEVRMNWAVGIVGMLPPQEPTIAITELLSRCDDPDDRDEVLESIQAFADIRANQALFEVYDSPVVPVHVDTEFTEHARAALSWVLFHHQGFNSPIGLPLRFALGMGRDEHLNDAQIAAARRTAELCRFPGAQAVAADGTSAQRCNLGVGCDEAGVCYALAHGDESQCGRAAVSPATADEMAARDDGFFAGICVALQVITAFDNGVMWAELVRTCDIDALLQYAAHVEPEEWELAGFEKYVRDELRMEKPEPALRASQAAAPAHPQGTFACPICGKETPHEHTSQEIAEHRSRKGA